MHSKHVSLILTILFTVLTLLLSWTFFNRMRLNYNSDGNYFDENSGVVYHEQALIVYGILALVSLLLTVLTFWKLKKLK